MKYVNRFYVDLDNVSSDIVDKDVKLLKGIFPRAKLKVILSSKCNYHIIVDNVNIPFDLAVKVIEFTHCDKAYINLVKMKGDFYIRVTEKMEAMI